MIDATLAETGTTYLVDDPTLVSVDENGFVQALAWGQTTLTIANGDIHLDLTVTVGPVLDESCIATSFNRTTQVDEQGEFALRNVPVPVGVSRVRFVCRQNGKTFKAQSDFAAGVPNGVTFLQNIHFLPDPRLPVSLTLTTPNPFLTPFLELAFPADQRVAQIRLLGNRQDPDGFDFFAGIFQAFDGVRRVRFTATADEGASPGFAEIQVLSRPGGRALDPADGDDDVPINTRAVVRLSEPLLPASLSASTVSLHAGTSVLAGSLALSEDGLSVTFTPSTELLPHTLYTLRVEALRDAAGNPMSETFETSFTTLEDTAPPTAQITTPRDGERMLAGSNVSVAFALADELAVESYAIFIDGRLEQAVSGLQDTSLSSSFLLAVPASAVSGQSLAVLVEAIDTAGNLASARLEVVVVKPDQVLSGDHILDRSLAGRALALAGAGTVYRRGGGAVFGDLIIDNGTVAGVVEVAEGDLGQGLYRFDTVTVRGGAQMVSDDPIESAGAPVAAASSGGLAADRER